jgi:WD40 repeat protein
MMALSGDERVLAVLNEQLNRLCVWNLETAESVWCAELGQPSDQSINFGQLQFSEDDRSVAVLSETGEILRWRRTDGAPLGPVPLTGDGEVSRGPAATGVFISSHRLSGGDNPCISWLVKDETKEVLFTSSLSRDFLSRFLQIPSTHCLFTPDGRLAIHVVSGGRIMVRRADNGETLAELAGHAGDMFTYAISPDGSLLASAGTDHVIYLWDLRYR